MLVGLIGGGALLLVLIVGGVVWFSSESNAHSPKAAAAPFLQALAKGDVTQAVKLGHIDTSSPLVTKSAYANVKDRITSFALKTQNTGKEAATVSVRYTIAGSTHSTSLTLKKAGTDMLFFTKWKLEPITLPTVDVSAAAPSDATVEINGKKVPVKGTTHFDVLPGRYDATLGANDYYAAKDRSVTVTGLTSTGSSQSLSLSATLTDKGANAADAAVNAWVDACIAQQSYAPDGCSFGLINTYSGISLSNQKWTLVTRPTFEVGSWDGSGWAVDTDDLGSATYTADAVTSDGQSGTFYSPSPVEVAVEGDIVGFKDGKAVFQSIDWSGKAATV